MDGEHALDDAPSKGLPSTTFKPLEITFDVKHNRKVQDELAVYELYCSLPATRGRNEARDHRFLTCQLCACWLPPPRLPENVTDELGPEHPLIVIENASREPGSPASVSFHCAVAALPLQSPLPDPW